MAKYIVYCLNEEGGIRRSQWIEADSDAQAVETARELRLVHGCEVWERDRFVGRVDALPD